MAFFRKKKKTSIREAVKALPPRREEPSVSVQPDENVAQRSASSSSDSATTPSTVVEDRSSIFSGLRVRGHGSPYLTKATEGLASEGKGQGDEGRSGELEQGGGGEGDQSVSAFDFISQEPPELPDSEEEAESRGRDSSEAGNENEKSVFPLLRSADSQTREEGSVRRNGDEGGHSTEYVDSPLMSQEAPPLITNSPLLMTMTTPTPATASSKLHDKSYELPSQSAFQKVRNSSGTVSPVPSPISPPLSSHQPPEGRTPVGKQQPSASKKKKKRKVVRPGQERVDDPHTTEDSSGSPKSNAAAVDMRTEVGSKIELDTVSLASSVEASRDSSSTATLSEPHRNSVTQDASEKTVTNERRDGATTPDAGQEGEGEGGETLGGEVSGAGSSSRGSGDVKSRQQEKPQTELLVDVSGVEQDHTERERKEKCKGDSSSVDQQLLAEVFTDDLRVGERGGREEEEEEGGEMKGGEGRRRREEGVGGKVTGGGVEEKVCVTENVNYSVELIASDQLTVLMQSSESNLARIRLDLSELHTQKQKSLDQHISAARQQRENRQQVKELRVREMKALSVEDYELAEELRGELESVSQDCSWSIASASHTLLREWLKEVCDLIQTEESGQSDIRTQLTEMREKQSQALSCAKEKIASTHTKHKMKLKTLEDKIERERGHIALDREHLQKREQQLQDEIASRAKKFISKKSTLQDELSTVNSDISELEAKLAELRQDKVRLQAAILEEEGRIEAIHHELDSENCSLHEERDSLTRREQHLQAQQEGVDQIKQEYETALQEEQAEKQSINGVLGQVDEKWAESERRTHTLVQSLSLAGELVKMDTSTILSPSQQLQRCREAVAVREGKVKEMAGQVLSLQSLISQLRRQITQTEERLPQLEDAKKAAVAARQYKEAGRVSAELKQLRAELEPRRKQLAESESEVSGQNQQLSTLSAELAQERERLEEDERQEDVEHVRHLASALARIQATKTSIPASSSPLGHVLECWYQLYQLLADGLCTKHDLELADFTPHMEIREEGEEEEEEGGRVDCTDTAITGSKCAESQDDKTTHFVPTTDQKSPEERTPGVGQEGGGDGEGEGEEGGEGATNVEQVKRKIAELESRIEEAVSEEVENYELAADLDRELSVLKETLKSS